MGFFKTIQGKLLGSLALLACVAAGIGIFQLMKLSESNQRTNLLATIIAPRIMVTDESDIALLNYIRCQKNAILAGNDTERQRFIAEQKTYVEKLNAVFARWEPIKSEQGAKELQSIRENFARYEQLNAQVVELARAGKTSEAEALSLGQAHEIYELIRSPLETSMQRSANTLGEKAQESDDVYRSTRWSILLIMFLGIGLSLAAAGFVTQQTVTRLHRVRDHLKDVAEGEGDLTKLIHIIHEDEIGELGKWLNKFLLKLQQMMAEVISGTNNIAAASQELAVTATEISRSANAQRQETMSVATAMQEMSATVVEVSSNSNQAAEAAAQAQTMARDGGEIVRATVDTIRALADDTRESSRRIQELGKSSDQIGKIIGVIDDIADQTNLLALNAAIEAARAGEQGRGFAVVADEVRKLAERTSGATREITTMVTSIQAETRKAVEAMNTSSSQVEIGVQKALGAGTALDNIIEGASGAQKMMMQIAASAQQQSSATDQVTRNMDQISQMVEQSSSAADESAKAIQDLSDQATQLQSLVGQFKVDNHDPYSSGRHNLPPIQEFSGDSHALYQ